MKKKSAAFVCLFAAIVMLAASLGLSSARYSSYVKVTKHIDFARVAGTISVYNPSWSWGYNATADGFDFSAGTTFYIHYQISNTAVIDGTTYTNQIETPYYIRLVPLVASDSALCTSWNVNKYASSGGVLFDKDPDLNAYGPFTLGTAAPSGDEAPSPEFVDIGFTCAANTGDIKGIRTFRVQMFSVRADNTERIISQDDLRIIATNESGYSDIKIEYWQYGSKTQIPNASQTLNVPTNTTIDFTNSESLEQLGIKIPEGNLFIYATCAADTTTIKDSDTGEETTIQNVRYDKMTVTDKFSLAAPIQVRVIKDGYVPVSIQYWDRNKALGGGTFEQVANTTQELQIAKGSTVDFNDQTSLAAAGVVLPDTQVYKYIRATCHLGNDFTRVWGADGNATDYFHNKFSVPDNASHNTVAIFDVYVAPIVMRENINIVMGFGSDTLATVQTTKNASGETQFTYNGVTLVFKDGKITIGYADLQKMFGSSYNWFEVFIRHEGNNLVLAEMKNSGSVTIDYYSIYQGNTASSTGYCLANPNIQLYIRCNGNA